MMTANTSAAAVNTEIYGKSVEPRQMSHEDTAVTYLKPVHGYRIGSKGV